VFTSARPAVMLFGRRSVTLALASVLALGGSTTASQCRLAAPGHANLGQSAASGSSSTPVLGASATATLKAGSPAATASSAANDTPAWTEFAYGDTPIRGVNL
jgi:hypothetical protein